MWGSHYEMLALGSCQTVPIHPIGSAWMPTAIKVCSHSHRQQVKQQMWSSFSTASRCGRCIAVIQHHHVGCNPPGNVYRKCTMCTIRTCQQSKGLRARIIQTNRFCPRPNSRFIIFFEKRGWIRGARQSHVPGVHRMSCDRVDHRRDDLLFVLYLRVLRAISLGCFTHCLPRS